jgi:N-acetylglucosaminyl-diphospho-decaprenol L-rhamnosyltransferase
MDNCLLSVVLVSWNTCDLLGKSIQSVRQYPPAGPFEIWVVDNASNDGSAAMVRERFPWVQLIENKENLGFAAANNQAIRTARGRYIALLNSDTELQPGALNALVGFMELHPRAGAAGARLLNADGSLQPSCQPMPTPERELWRLLFLDRLWPRATYRMHRWSADTPRRVEVIQGACLLLRREALDQVGLLDESYFMYAEEVDLCYRMDRAGWERWWVPQAQVVHLGGRSTQQVAETMYLQLYRSKVQFYRKYGSARRADYFKWLVKLAYWPRLAVAALGAAARPSLRPKADLYRSLLTELPEM